MTLDFMRNFRCKSNGLMHQEIH